MDGISLAIIAGGKSSRMGTDKAFVEINGQSLIERILERIGDIGQVETFIVTNRPNDYTHLNLTMYSDVLQDKGSLGGIYTAIHYSRSPYTFVTACDMPFVNADLMRFMIDLCEKDEFDVIVPRVDGYPQGLHAIYSQRCANPIRTKIDKDRLKVIGFYDDVRVHYLDEADYENFSSTIDIFHNVNTPEDLEQARQLAHKN